MNELSPLANVRSVGGEGKWQAENDDPQFLLHRADGRNIKGGFYHFQVSVSSDVPVTHPILYPDYGNGYSMDTQIPLPPPDGSGGIDALVILSTDPVSVRFDPTNRQSTFELRDVSLRPKGRVWVLWKTAEAVALRRGESVLKSCVRLLARTAGVLLREGARAAGDDLISQYRESIRPADGGYEGWFSSYASHACSESTRRERLERLQSRPTISILLPTYNTPERWLCLAIESVLAQSYPHWELCIADDASGDPAVRRLIDSYVQKDQRIRVVYRETNGHISSSSNTALGMAGGEYVALMDHDDELAPDALLHVVEAINLQPSAKLIFTDEDKIDETGRHYDPYFKPDLNRDLLLGQNCVCHFGVYHKRLMEQLGGFRKGYEGAQDWDLALRATELLQDKEVVHVPKVVYHWRSISGSTARGGEQKDYAAGAGMRAVRDHLQRVNVEAEVTADEAGYLSIRRRLPELPPLVTIIIPTRDKAELLRLCVESILLRTRYPAYEVLVIDNGSVEDETFALFDSWSGESRVKVLRYDHPFNYSSINNFGYQNGAGDVICLMNNDIEVITPDWLGEMVTHALRSDVGAVGAMLYYPNDTIQHAGVVTGIGSVAGHVYVGKPRGYAGQMGRARLTQEVSAVTAACMVLRREVMEQVGGLDEGLKVAFNDIDLCLRIRRLGYRIIWTPLAELYHHESASRGYEDTPEKRERFEREVVFMKERWGKSLALDPFYNPNLTIDGEPYGLSYPPRV